MTATWFLIIVLSSLPSTQGQDFARLGPMSHELCVQMEGARSTADGKQSISAYCEENKS